MRLAVHPGALLALLLAAPAALADDPYPRIPATGTQYLEGDRTQISSRAWLRGAHLEGGGDVATRPQLTAFLPGEWKDFCARFTLVSGRLITVSDFKAPAGWTGARALLDMDLTEEVGAVVAATTARDSGVTIENRACDAMGSEEELVYSAGFWNSDLGPGDAPPRMVLNLNISRADELVTAATLYPGLAGTAAPQRAEVSCVRLDSTATLSFNYQCTADLLGHASGRLHFEYQRLYAGELSDPRAATIIFGM